jgi:hypothetical protein
MNFSNKQVVLSCLDSLAVSLTEHDHQWSDQQRQDYEAAVALLTSDGCRETGSSASD